MKIVLSSIGSTGDIQPFLALAIELKKRGHQVRMCAQDVFRKGFDDAGIDFATIGLPWDMEVANRVLSTLETMKSPKQQAELLVDAFYLKTGAEMYRDCLAAFAGFDLAICHAQFVYGQEAAIQLGMPWVGAMLDPSTLRTEYSSFYPGLSLGKTLNRLSWKLLDKLLENGGKRIAEQIYTLSGRQRRIHPSACDGASGILIAASEHLCPIYPDTLDRATVTGPWTVPDASDWEAPVALRDFIAAEAEKPLVVTFGSMGGQRAEESARILIEALEMTGRRAIIQSGFSGLRASHPLVYSCDFVPHGYLFAQASAVVHHVGAGTAYAACLAGVPSIAVPHLFDQPYWGLMLHQRGLAPKPIPRNKLTARKLAVAIREVQKPEYGERARALAPKLRSENGAARAADAVEALRLAA